jgi:hypothetical protein
MQTQVHLSQYNNEGTLQPRAFFSRKMNPAEMNYDIHDKELLLGSDPAWALSDTKLNSEDLWLARRRAASE